MLTPSSVCSSINMDTKAWEHQSPVAHRYPRNPTPLRKHTIRIPSRPRLPFLVLPTNRCNVALAYPNANSTVGQASTNVIILVLSRQAVLGQDTKRGDRQKLGSDIKLLPSGHSPLRLCGRFADCEYVCETRSKRDEDLGCRVLGPAWLRGVSYRGVGLGIDLDGRRHRHGGGQNDASFLFARRFF